jgi:hypothetical protein
VLAIAAAIRRWVAKEMVGDKVTPQVTEVPTIGRL